MEGRKRALFEGNRGRIISPGFEGPFIDRPAVKVKSRSPRRTTKSSLLFRSRVRPAESVRGRSETSHSPRSTRQRATWAWRSAPAGLEDSLAGWAVNCSSTPLPASAGPARCRCGRTPWWPLVDQLEDLRPPAYVNSQQVAGVARSASREGLHKSRNLLYGKRLRDL